MYVYRCTYTYTGVHVVNISSFDGESRPETQNGMSPVYKKPLEVYDNAVQLCASDSHTESIGFHPLTSHTPTSNPTPHLHTPCHISITRQNGYGLRLGSHLHISLGHIFQKVAMASFFFFFLILLLCTGRGIVSLHSLPPPTTHCIHIHTHTHLHSYLRTYMLDWVKSFLVSD